LEIEREGGENSFSFFLQEEPLNLSTNKQRNKMLQLHINSIKIALVKLFWSPSHVARRAGHENLADVRPLIAARSVPLFACICIV